MFPIGPATRKRECGCAPPTFSYVPIATFLDPYLAYSISGTWDGEALADNGRLWVCSVQDPTRANELDLVVRLLSDAPASGSASAHGLQWQFAASGDLTDGDHPPITVGVTLGPIRSADPSRVAVLVGHEGERFGWDD